jgi:glycosyltransferase involved in cell wall biosynthesis
MPKISVIMPSYNHERFVVDAVKSVQRQTVSDWELIVVDDGSSDDSARLLNEICDPKVRVTLLDRNRGACFAMNAALDQAMGEYIAVLNSDDVAHPDRLAKQLAFIERYPAALATFALPRFIDDDGNACTGGANDVFFTAPHGGRAQWLRRFIDHANFLCHPTLFARRELYEKVGRYDNTLVQLPDFDMWVRTLRHGAIEMLRESVIDFRVLRNNANTSAPTTTAIVRCHAELYWIARRFFEFPDELIVEALGGKHPSTLQSSPALMLARYMKAQDRPYSVMAALDAVREMLLREDSSELRQELQNWTGQCDPFGLVVRSRAAAFSASPPSSFAAAFGRRSA